MVIVIGILLGILCGIATFFLIDRISIQDKKLPQQFRKEQQKVINGLVEKKNAIDKEFNEEAERRHKERKRQLEAEYTKEAELLAAQQQMEIESYSKATEDAKYKHSRAISQLEHDYKEKAERYKREEEIANLTRRQNMEKEIQDEQRRFSNSLEKLNADYKEKKEAIDESFFNYSAAVNQKRAALEQEIQTYENKQKEIINRFKADEERRQKANFYKIELTKEEKEDIARLKEIADTLHNPNILYKLIWENYYKNKFSELMGRINANKEKCGIYKITNIKNQKVYIGQTRQIFSERMRSHVKKGLRAEPTTNNKLYNAMWTDGVENFTFEILCTCAPEELNKQESYYINFYQAVDWGFNTQRGKD